MVSPLKAGEDLQRIAGTRLKPKPKTCRTKKPKKTRNEQELDKKDKKNLENTKQKQKR